MLKRCAVGFLACVCVLGGEVVSESRATGDSLISDFRVINDRALVRVANTNEAYFVFVVSTNVVGLQSTPDQATVIPRRGAVTDFFFNNTNASGSTFFFALRSNANCDPIDNDGDGIDDVLEALVPFLDASNPMDAFADDDGDGWDNRTEIYLGTNPNDLDDSFGPIDRTRFAPVAGSVVFDGGFVLNVADDMTSPFQAAGGGRAGAVWAALNVGPYPDLVAIDPFTDELEIYIGQPDGTLSLSTNLPTGGTGPLAVDARNVIGDAAIDVIVGHSDGRVTFFEGDGDGGLTFRPALTVTNLGTIVSITAEDVDGDGDLDIVVSGGDQVTVLFNVDDPVASDPIANGSFADGLRDWSVLPNGGRVSIQGGRALLEEQSAFQTGIEQVFHLPANPETLTFDILESRLVAAPGALPDAFEVWLTDVDGNPLVPAFRPDAETFFNRSGAAGARLAVNTSVNTNQVTLDLASLPGDQAARVRFALIGAPGENSFVAIDHVSVQPDAIFVESFVPVALPGAFTNSGGVVATDRDGNGLPDILVEDAGLGMLILFENQGGGVFVRNELPPFDYGCPPELPWAFDLAGSVSEAKYFVADGLTWQVHPYLIDGTALDPVTPVAGTAIQSLETHPDGSRTWLIHAGDPQLYVYDANLNHLGTWTPDSISNVIDMAVAGADLWVLGQHEVFLGGDPEEPENYETEYRLSLFENEIARTSGSTAPDAQWTLPAGVAAPRYLISDALELRVMDDTARMVYNFDFVGTLLGQWSLAADNTNPRGLARSGTDLFVADRDDLVVYRYAGDMNRVSGTGTATEAFALSPSNLEPIDISDPATPIEFDELVEDTFVTGGEIFEYLFEVSSATSFLIEGEAGGGEFLDPEYQIRAPDDTLVAQGGFFDRGPFQLETTGTYSLAMSLPFGGDGSFSFVLRSFVPGAPVPMVPDVEVAGSISVTGEIDRFSFVVTNSAVLSFAHDDGNSQAWRLLAPDGAQIETGYWFEEGPYFLNATGTYYYDVYDFPESTGDYSFTFSLLDLDAPTAIQLDTVYSNNLASAPEFHVYSLNITTQTVLFADYISRDDFGYQWQLLNPAGQAIFDDSFNNISPVKLSGPGEHLLYVYSESSTGNYSFRIQDSTPVAEPLILDTATTGTFTAGQARLYEWAATSNQIIYISRVSGSSSFEWELLGPTSLIDSETFFVSSGPYTLATTGTHAFALYARDGGFGTVTFEIQTLLEQPATPPTNITINAVIENTISNAFWSNRYTFVLSDPNTLIFDRTTGSSSDFGWRLLDPDGGEVFDASMFDRSPQFYSTTGTYELVVYSRSVSVPATYGFEIIAPSPPPPPVEIFVDTVVTGVVAEAFQLTRFDIDLTAGQRIKARTLVGSQFSFDWDFFDPATNMIFGGNFRDEDTFVVSTTGTYRLDLTGDSSQTGAVEFIFLEIPPNPAPEPLVLDQVYSPVMYPDLTYTYELSVTNPVIIFFDALEASNGSVFASHHLTDPMSNAVFGPISSSDRGPFTLDEPGTYTLTVAGTDSGDVTNYFFQVWSVPQNPAVPLGFGDAARAVLAIPGEIAAYSFEGEAGEAIYLDNLFGDDAFSIRIVDPDGTVLGSADADNDLDTVVLATGGVHRVEVFFDGFSSDPFHGTNSFRLWKVLESESQPIAVGDVVNGSLPSPRGTAVYAFEAAAGDVLFFDRQNGPGSVGSNNGFTWELLAPSSATVFSTNYSDVAGVAVTETGTHTLRVTGGFNANTPFFQFKVWDWEPLTRTIAYGEAVSDYLSAPGLTNQYFFAASAGDEVVLDAVVGGGMRWSLHQPNGTQIASSGGGDLNPGPLPVTGTYEIRVIANFPSTNHEQNRYAFLLDLGPLPLTVPPAADLAATMVSAPPVVVATAAVVEVTWTVTNTAPVATVSTGWTDRIYLSTGEAVFDRGDESYIDVPRAGGLAANAAYTATQAVALPPGFEGEFRVHVVADYTNAEFEADEADNLSDGTLVSIYPEPRNLDVSPAIEVNLTDGARFPQGETIVLNGTAKAVAASENLFVVFDVSGSAFLVTDFDVNQDGVIDDRDNLNNDEYVGSSFDVQIAALQRLEEVLAATGTDLRVIPVLWAAEAFPADIAPDRFLQNYYQPGADRNMNGQPDILEALLSIDYFDFFLTSSVFLNGFTYYDQSPGNNLQRMVESLITRIDQAPPVGRNRVFFFVDAGPATNGDANTNSVLSLASRSISFEAFQFINPAPVAEETQRLADLIDSDPSSSGRATVLEETEDLVRRVVETLAVAGVTINGVGAESVDSAGRFFSRYTVQPGTQTVAVAAYDTRGVSVSRSFTIVGYDPNDTNDVVLADLGDTLDLTYPSLTWRDSDHTLVADAAVVNRGAYAQRSPFEARIVGIEPVGASIVSPDRTEPDGTPVLAFDPYGLDLAPGATGLVRQAAIANPTRGRVRLTAAVYGRPNAIPRFTTVPPASVLVSNLWTYTAEVIDDDGDPVVLSVLERPEGMFMVSNTLSWTPGPSEVGYHNVRLRAEDDRGGRAEQNFRILVEENAGNRPPVFLSVPPTELASGLDYLYVPEVRDADGDTLAFQLIGSPAGFSVDATNGTVAYPAIPDGVYPLELEADDGTGGIAVQRFDLSVGIASTNSSAPVILTTPPTIAMVGESYLYFPSAYDPDGDPVTFSLSTAPAGMEIQPANGHIAWIPATNQVGPHAVLLRAEDTGGLFASQFYTITVSTSAVNRLPVITATPAGMATVNEPYTALIAAEDPEAQPITFSLELAPSGLTLDPNTGAIVWTPATGDVGMATARVAATDVEGASAYLTWFIDVRASNTPPVFVSTPPTSVPAGATYRYTALATDEEDGVSYVLLEGPGGMTLDPALGVVRWETSAADIGSELVRIGAVDERELRTEQAFTLTVAPDNTSPEVMVTVSTLYVTPGETSTVRVTVADDVGVVDFGLRVDDVDTALDGSGSSDVVPLAPGLLPLEGYAVDAAGNTGVYEVVLRVFDPSDTNAPNIVITSPTNQTGVAMYFAIEGAISDPEDNLDYYTIDIARADALDHVEPFVLDLNCDDCFTELVRVHTSSVNGVLGHIDPTVYANDDYVIRVTAFDINGQGWTEGVVVNVRGQVKPGQFTLDFTDVRIPTRGVPIEIVRRYDTLRRDSLDAFGFGWSLLAQDPDIRETVPDDILPYSAFSLYPLYVGARVYLNDPDGYRVGYTFDAPFAQGSLLGALYQPLFEPDAGVFDVLEDPTDNLLVTLQDGGNAQLPLVAVPYNPRQYRLTRRDGSVYLYDQVLGLQQVADRYGNTVTYTPDSITHSDGYALSILRDTLNRVTSIVSTQGVLAAYTYDDAGNLATHTDAENRTTQFLYFDEPAHTLRAIIGPDGQILHEAEFDEAGRMVRQSAGGAGHESDFDPGTFTGVNRDPFGRETVVTYNETNALIERVERPDGELLEFAYDEHERLITIARDGYETHYAYNNTDELTMLSNANGYVWTYEYNASTIDVIGPTGEVFQLTLTEDGNNIRSLVRPTGVGMGLGYDDKGRITHVTNENGVVTFMTYGLFDVPESYNWADGASRVFDFDADGTLNTVIDEAGYITTYAQDQKGAIVEVVDHAGHTATMAFNDTLPSAYRFTDADGNTIERVDLYDTNGVLTAYRILWPNGEETLCNVVPGIPAAVTNFVGPGALNQWSIFFGGATNRVLDAEGREEIYVMRGNEIQSFTDRLGRERIFHYDPRNQLTQEVWKVGGVVTNIITVDYNESGYPSRISDWTATLTYTRDGDNRVTGVNTVGTSNSIPAFSMTYAYDGVGNVLSSGDSLGLEITSSYDVRDQLLARAWELSGQFDTRVAIERNLLTLPTRMERYAAITASVPAVVSTMAYDYDRGITNLFHVQGGSSNTMAAYTYAYSPARLVTQMTFNAETFGYVHDPLGQVVQVDRSVGGDETYAWTNGNPAGALTGPQNELLEDGEWVMTYDAVGNMISRSNQVSGARTHFAYDVRDRLVRVETFDGSGASQDVVDYRYDALDRRVARIENGTPTYTVFEFGFAHADLDAATNLVAVYLNSEEVDQRYGRWQAGSGLHWYLADARQNVRQIADSQGAVAATVDYSAFGAVLSNSAPSVTDRFLWAGREYDAIAGMYHFYFRQYDPVLKRFANQDPIRYSRGEYHMYRYAFNSPVTEIDYFGLAAAIEYPWPLVVQSFFVGCLMSVGESMGCDAAKAAGAAIASGGASLAQQFTVDNGGGKATGYLWDCAIGGAIGAATGAAGGAAGAAGSAAGGFGNFSLSTQLRASAKNIGKKAIEKFDDGGPGEMLGKCMGSMGMDMLGDNKPPDWMGKLGEGILWELMTNTDGRMPRFR